MKATLAKIGAIVATTAGSAEATAQTVRVAEPASPSSLIAGDTALFGSSVVRTRGPQGNGSIEPIAFPGVLPEERAQVPLPILPQYVRGGGIGPFGHGWVQSLEIRRVPAAISGLDRGGSLVSPWGALVLGDDARYYPVAFQARVRAEPWGAGWLALGPEGERYEFDLVTAGDRWLLTRVQHVDGTQMRLTYSAETPAAVPQLVRVTYGDAFVPDGHRVDFVYAPIPDPIVSHRFGEEEWLDRRVVAIDVSSRPRSGHDFVHRWRWNLGYREAPYGPGFFLQNVGRTFASGESAPAVVFGYGRRHDALTRSDAGAEAWPSFDVLLRANRADRLGPVASQYADLDRDGDLELLVSKGAVALSRSGGRWRTVSARPANDEERQCLEPGATETRALATLRPSASLDVLVVSPSASNGLDVHVCGLGGETLGRVAFTEWSADAEIHVGDLDRDGLADLLAVSPDTVSVALNRTTAHKITFSKPRSLGWTARQGSVLADLDGDGWLDLVDPGPGSTLGVRYGLGGGGFDAGARRVGLVDEVGQRYAFAEGAKLQLEDADGDGLDDLIVTSASTIEVFTRRGHTLRRVARISSPSPIRGQPVLLDTNGDGTRALVWTVESKPNRVYRHALTTPNTDLLVSMDDRRGLERTRQYVFHPGHVGIGVRPRVVGSTSRYRAGAGVQTAEHRYRDPHIDSLSGLWLGFERVESVDGHGDRTIRTFAFPGTGRAELTQVLTYDRSGVTGRYTRTAHQLHFSFGVPWARPVRTEKGLVGEGGEVGEVTDVVRWARAFCPVVSRRRADGDVLTETLVLASVSAWPDDLSCAVRERSVSSPGRKGPDVLVSRERFERDATGRLLTRERRYGGRWITVERHERRGRMWRYLSTETGTTTTWLGPDGLALAIVGPDGTTEVIAERDPRHLAPTRRVVRDGHRTTEHGRAYDGRERLATEWSSARGGSARRPNLKFRYTDPSSTGPGVRLIETLGSADADADVGMYRRSATLVDAIEAVRAELDETPDGWIVRSLNAPLDGSSVSLSLRSAPWPVTADMPAPRWTDLIPAGLRDLLERGSAPMQPEQCDGDTSEGVWCVGYAARGASGLVSTERVSADDQHVIFRSSRVRVLDGAVQRLVDDGALQRTEERDGWGRLRRVRGAGDEAWDITYDARGPSALQTAGRRRFVLSSDELGALYRVDSSEFGSLVRAREASTGRFRRWERFDANGVSDGAVRRHFDAAGRVEEVEHVAAGGSVRLVYFVTRVPPESQQDLRWVIEDLPGVYRRSQGYAPDGQLGHDEWHFWGWRRVVLRHDYDPDGQRRRTTVTTYDAARDALLHRHVRTYARDPAGRLVQLQVDGRSVLSLAYDAQGRVRSATLADGTEHTWSYDQRTLAPNGFGVRKNGGKSTVALTYGTDGRLRQEVERVIGAAAPTTRTFDYDARGFLKSVTEAAMVVGRFDFNAEGEVSSIRDALGEREPSSRTPVKVLGQTYVHDAYGRVAFRGSDEFVYGVDDQLKEARLRTEAGTTRTLTFVNDAFGRRLAKRRDGAFAAAYPGEAFLDRYALYEPLVVSGRLVGALRDGVLMGPPSSPGDAPRMTPFLARVDSAVGSSEAFEYLGYRYDPELRLIYDGRDYDPALGRYWQPDLTTFFGRDGCLTDPRSCRPLAFGDGNPLPTFEDARSTMVGFGLARAVAKVGTDAMMHRSVLNDTRVRTEAAVTAVTPVAASASALSLRSSSGVRNLASATGAPTRPRSTVPSRRSASPSPRRSSSSRRTARSSDTAPPQLALKTPLPVATTAAAITLAGVVTDVGSGVAQVRVINRSTGASIEIPVGDRGALFASIPLTPGPNPLAVEATDLAGNVSSTPYSVNQMAPVTPEVTITAPTPGATHLAAVDVTGLVRTTIAIAELTVSLNGASGTLTPNAEGASFTFSAVPLQLGTNVLTVAVTGAFGALRQQVVVQRLPTSSRRPSISLDPSQSPTYVSANTAPLSGTVTSTGCVQSVTVDGFVPTSASGLGTVQAAFQVDIDVPSNPAGRTVVVQATGCNGLVETASLTFIRRCGRAAADRIRVEPRAGGHERLRDAVPDLGHHRRAESGGSDPQ